MTPNTLFRAALIWLVIAVLAIGNGLFRNEVMAPAFGQGLALPLSGFTLSLIVLIVTYLAYPFLKLSRSRSGWLVGLQWVCMTLIFEFTFGHYVAGKPWEVLLQTFNPFGGNLFILVLLVTLIAPALVVRYRE